MTELPAREDFLKYLNTKFKLFLDAEQSAEVELTEVGEMTQRSDYGAFSMVFIAPKTVPPVQRLYLMEHEALGALELFLVPFEENEKGFAFEALFNRKITAQDG